jgi:Mu-like prophage tail sheath protein gpL
MSSPNISFSTIPGNIRRPGVYVEENTSNALQGLQPANDNIVILAQMTSSGIATPLVPQPIFDAGTAQLQFGAGSVAHLTAQAALAANPYARISVMPLLDMSGTTKATGTVVIGDTTASANGQLNVWVGDQLVQYPFLAGDSKASIAAGLMGVLAPIAQQLPVTDTSSAGTVTFTAKNGGIVGNHIALGAQATAGLASVTATAMASGATDSTVGPYTTTGTPLNLIQGAGYTVVVNTIPSATALGQVTAFNTFVSGAMEQRPCVQIAATTDLVGTQAAVVALAAGLNDGRTSLGYMSYANGGAQAKSEAYKIAGAYAGVIGLQSDPAVPYDGLILANIASPAVVDRFSRSAEEYLFNNGVAPFDVAPGDAVEIVRAITTYTVNSLAIPDITLLDINTIRTLDYVRAQIRARLANTFVRAKLTAKIAASIKDQVVDVLTLLQDLEIVQNVAQYMPGIIVETDTSMPTQIDVRIPSNIVSGLHVIAGQIILIL